ncbi:hypothetical protein [Paenibacillus qinlingensis]|uniref:hypothetical protein n=1 Tax=Paenibacillus qinlingensis TaxID=1837343 RepID=UPI001FE762EF|nr:hypothetical protein [Paenibacillus qinlingensis]
MENGLSAYDLLSVEGNAAKRITGQEVKADVTGNSVVLKDSRHANYKFYLAITNIIKSVINNIRKPHEKQAVKLLFIDGMEYLKARAYIEKGYKKDIDPIAATTFADEL